jgi:hypothetical protein
MPTLTPVSCPPHSTARRPRPGGCRFGRAWRDRRPCDVPGRLHDGLEGGLGACQAQGARGGQELAEGRALRDACFLTRMAGISRPVTCALYAAELSLLPWRFGSTLSVRRRSKGRRGSRSSQPTVASKGGRPGLFDLSLSTTTLPSALPPALFPALQLGSPADRHARSVAPPCLVCYRAHPDDDAPWPPGIHRSSSILNPCPHPACHALLGRSRSSREQPVSIVHSP